MFGTPLGGNAEVLLCLLEPLSSLLHRVVLLGALGCTQVARLVQARAQEGGGGGGARGGAARRGRLDSVEQQRARRRAQEERELDRAVATLRLAHGLLGAGGRSAWGKACCVVEVEAAAPDTDA